MMGNLELSETNPACRLMLGAEVNVDEHHGGPNRCPHPSHPSWSRSNSNIKPIFLQAGTERRMAHLYGWGPYGNRHLFP